MAKLSDLKKLVDAARASGPEAEPARPSKARGGHHPAPTHARKAATRRADGDVDLAQAFADVQKLPPSTRATHSRPRPAPIPRQRLADDADVLVASKYGTEPAPDSWEIGQEHEAGQTYLRRGLGSDILGKLRRGHWSVQSEIDLHGHTTDEAHDALADFLDEARKHGYRCVRVIHGKGLTSPNKEPVLKGKVRKWLSYWDDVLAYCEAPPHAGGGGAVLILLRGR
jgi:DNA-nicking Smr family endonuclease